MSLNAKGGTDDEAGNREGYAGEQDSVGDYRDGLARFLLWLAGPAREAEEANALDLLG